MITLEEIASGLARIDGIKADDERAHKLEDELHQEVLRAIADGAPDAAELARAALQTKDIDFSRWYA